MNVNKHLSHLLLGGVLALQTACSSAASADVVAPPPPPEAPVSISSYVLLDRTGSMRGIWDEALGSINAYVDEMGKPEDDGSTLQSKVTLAAFDYQEGFQFEVLRDGVTPNDWVGVTNAEVQPRGMTPLFDAIGQILSLAEADAPDKAVIVIMTDGRENSSKELNADKAKQALDKATEKGWEVVFLGADFASFGDAEAVGVSNSKSLGVSRQNLAASQRNLANKVKGYATGKEETIVFDAEDRAEAGEEELKQRKGQ